MECRYYLLSMLRNKTEWLMPLFFFVITASLLPLSVNPDAKTLQLFGPGMVWISALLAWIISLENLFKEDFDEGILEQMLHSQQSLPWIIFKRLWMHWFFLIVPLLISAGIIGLSYALPAKGLLMLLISLAIGTPMFSFGGSIAVALLLGLKKGAGWLVLLVVPWMIPALILGTLSVSAAIQELPVSSYCLLLSALNIFALTVSPFATAFAIRISLAC